MNFITFLVSLGLMAAACSNPISSSAKCPANCEETDHFQPTDFRHVSDLQSSSVAPWTLNPEYKDGREPYFIQNAVCQDGCNMQNMEPKRIVLEISVYEVVRNSSIWCKCPYELAVGCTCVKTTASE